MTGPDHAAVDEIYSHFDLTTAEGYGDFLAAQHACLAPIEAALTEAGVQTLLSDWPSRRRAALLSADLADLGISPPPPLPAPALAGPAALLGAVYVLEGSRFGGQVLRRRVAPTAPQRFLGARPEPMAWRALVAMMEAKLSSERAFAVAAAAAKAAFHGFERAARRQLDGALG